jgi:hypothetical protein
MCQMGISLRGGVFCFTDFTSLGKGMHINGNLPDTY